MNQLHKILCAFFALLATSLVLAQDSNGDYATETPADPLADMTVVPVDPEQPQPVEAVIDDTQPAVTIDETPEPTPPAPPPLPVLEMDLMDSGAELQFPMEETAPSMTAQQADTISVDFPEEEVRNIVRSVADLYGLNVVIPDLLQGTTTIKLDNVTWQQVFDVVLDPLGYTYVEEGNIIKIKSVTEIDGEPPITQVFIINYARADDVRSAVAPMVDAAKGGLIQVDSRLNMLIVTERPSQMNNIQIIIDELDRATEQVMIESKFIEVSDGDNRNLGLDWSSLNSYKVFGVEGMERTYNKQDSRALTNNRGFDSTVTTTDNQNSTVSATDQGVTFSDDTENGVDNEFENTLENSVDFTSTITRGTNAIFSAGDFELILNLLQGYTDSRVVTNPTVVTLDGEEAKIVIGQQYPIPAYTYNDDRGTFEVSGFDFKDIGVVMSVRPQVNSDGFIRLEVNPELSSIEGTVAFGGAAQAIPVVSTTQTRSSVILKDGYTLAIGGLLQSSKNNRSTSVPFFSDVPLLGNLFKTESDTYAESNLIIFITAKTLNPDATTYREIIDPRILNRIGLNETDLPGYRLPEEQQEMLDQIDALRNRAAREQSLEGFRTQLDALEQAERARNRLLLEAAEEAQAQEDGSSPFIRRR